MPDMQITQHLIWNKILIQSQKSGSGSAILVIIKFPLHSTAIVNYLKLFEKGDLSYEKYKDRMMPDEKSSRTCKID
jgi:hypothetical protein